jgi:hypothetical protein
MCQKYFRMCIPYLKGEVSTLRLLWNSVRRIAGEKIDCKFLVNEGFLCDSMSLTAAVLRYIMKGIPIIRSGILCDDCCFLRCDYALSRRSLKRFTENCCPHYWGRWWRQQFHLEPKFTSIPECIPAHPEKGGHHNHCHGNLKSDMSNTYWYEPKSFSHMIYTCKLAIVCRQ